MNESNPKEEDGWNVFVVNLIKQSSYERGRLSERRRIIRIIKAEQTKIFFRQHNCDELIEKIK